MTRAGVRPYLPRPPLTSVLAALLLFGPGPTRAAAQETSGDEQRALDLFMEAEQAYEEGEVERAVALLQEARTLRREPVLLYNLARAYETLGRIDEALAAYEQYLVEEPDGSGRGAIETRVTALRRQIAEREALAEAERLARERPRPPPARPSALPWVTLGAGALSLGVAVTLGALAWDAREDAENDPAHSTATASLALAEDLALGANILYVIGGALALGGAIWGVIDLASSDLGEHAEARLRIGPGLARLDILW
ncbi:MAG: tetratricopeptide repeat protein [Sandaracinaceae bacterium]